MAPQAHAGKMKGSAATTGGYLSSKMPRFKGTWTRRQLRKERANRLFTKKGSSASTSTLSSGSLSMTYDTQPLLDDNGSIALEESVSLSYDLSMIEENEFSLFEESTSMSMNQPKLEESDFSMSADAPPPLEQNAVISFDDDVDPFEDPCSNRNSNDEPDENWELYVNCTSSPSMQPSISLAPFGSSSSALIGGVGGIIASGDGGGGEDVAIGIGIGVGGGSDGSNGNNGNNGSDGSIGNGIVDKEESNNGAPNPPSQSPPANNSGGNINTPSQETQEDVSASTTQQGNEENEQGKGDRESPEPPTQSPPNGPPQSADPASPANPPSQQMVDDSNGHVVHVDSSNNIPENKNDNEQQENEEQLAGQNDGSASGEAENGADAQEESSEQDSSGAQNGSDNTGSEDSREETATQEEKENVSSSIEPDADNSEKGESEGDQENEEGKGSDDETQSSATSPESSSSETDDVNSSLPIMESQDSDANSTPTVESITCPLESNSTDAAADAISSDNAENGLNYTLVTYAYEVETVNVSTASSFLPLLEEQILFMLANETMECLQDQRRMLVWAGLRRRHRQLEEYNVLGIESTPEDVEGKEGVCSIELNETDSCFIIDGGLTLLLPNTTNQTLAIESSQAIIRDAMANDVLLSPEIPQVLKVKYLADSYEEYLAGLTAIALPIGIIVEQPPEDNSNVFAAILSSALIFLLALIILLLLCVRRRRQKRWLEEQKSRSEMMRERRMSRSSILKQSSYKDRSSPAKSINRLSPVKSIREIIGGSIASSAKKKLDPDGTDSSVKAADPDGFYDKDVERELDSELDNVVADIDAIGNRTRSKRDFLYTDPPGAFHLGNHHYTEDGVRYYSPHCEMCIKARAELGDEELAIGQKEVKKEKTDHEDDLSYDLAEAKQFTDYNVHELGKLHSSVHVRSCKSTTCEICRKAKGVVFLKSAELASTPEDFVS